MEVRPSHEPPLPVLVPFPHPLNLSAHPSDPLHSIDPQAPLTVRHRVPQVATKEGSCVVASRVSR